MSLLEKRNHSHLKYTGGKGYGYLLETFVPLLKERGVTDEQIYQMMVVNPVRAFSRRRRDTGYTAHGRQ